MRYGGKLGRRHPQIRVYTQFPRDPEELTGFQPQGGVGIALMRTIGQVAFTLSGIRPSSMTRDHGGMGKQVFKHGWISFVKGLSNHMAVNHYVVSIRKDMQ
jgi:hypothetical protein